MTFEIRTDVNLFGRVIGRERLSKGFDQTFFYLQRAQSPAKNSFKKLLAVSTR